MIRGFKLDLPDPDAGRVFFPALTNIAKRWLVERALLQQFGVLLPAFGFFCTDNRGVHSRNAEGEAQGDRNAFLQIVVEKIVIQFPQSFPVFVMIRINWTMPRFPGRVGNRPLRDHAHLFSPANGRVKSIASWSAM